MKRHTKQGIIGIIYLLLITLLGAAIFYAFFYVAPSCTDNKQNQNETGVDCGGICSQYCIADLASIPLSFEEVTLLPYDNDSSDALARVKNSNGKAALKSAKYTFTVTGSNGEVLASQSGVLSLLPKEEKTLLALGLPVTADQKLDFVVTNEEWIAFTEYDEAPNIAIVNQHFDLLSSGVGYAEAFALVRNISPYDMRSLVINVVIRDANGKALSVNKTTINTLQSGEERDFTLVWPKSFLGEPKRADMTYDFNSFDTQAFVKQYFPTGKYQTLEPGQ